MLSEQTKTVLLSLAAAYIAFDVSIYMTMKNKTPKGAHMVMKYYKHTNKTVPLVVAAVVGLGGYYLMSRNKPMGDLYPM